MNHKDLFLGQSNKSAWAPVASEGRPREKRVPDASWGGTGKTTHGGKVASAVVLPRMDDAEVAAYEESDFDDLAAEMASMRRTPGAPLQQALRPEDDADIIGRYELDGYNAWSGTNIISGIMNRSAVLESPLKFVCSHSSSETPILIAAQGADIIPTPKRSTSPIRRPSPPGRRLYASPSPLSMKESKFVEKVLKTFSSSQEAHEAQIRAASQIEKAKQHQLERDSAMLLLRTSLLNINVGDSTSTEGHNSIGLERESADSPGRPMSPRTKAACKDFVREFRRLERISSADAQEYARAALKWIPQAAQWRVHLQLADFAKRLNQEEEAHREYQCACDLEPTASKGKFSCKSIMYTCTTSTNSRADHITGWIEWSKMQDECGSTEMALQTVLRGILACSTINSASGKFDEVLILRALRLYEKQHRYWDARLLICSVCKNQVAVDKIWRVLFEGAQIEARAGNISCARELYSFLMHHIPWYGPIYSEAFRLEETGHHLTSCLHIIRRGLQELHRYGPLWFGLLRVMEKIDVESEQLQWATVGGQPELPLVKFYLNLAVEHISRELVWKIHFEMGQIQERAAGMSAEGSCWSSSRGLHFDGRMPQSEYSITCVRNTLLGPARKAYLESLLSCPSNLRWKVLLAGARMELSAGKWDKSRELLSEAMKVVPSKSRATVQLECARLEEFLNNFAVSRQVLLLGCREMPTEWRIPLELAMQQSRQQDYIGALDTLVLSVENHANTGRLWALIIQVFSSAWKKDSSAVQSSIWNLFEKTNYFADYYVYLCPEQKGADISGSFDAILKCSMESLSLTDTEASVESINFLKEAMKEKMMSEIQPCSSYLSTQKMRCIRRLVAKLALDEVPKSGECWCEAARCVLNPMDYVSEFDLASAHRYLSYAVLFTPQYGDSFIELIRLEILCQAILPRVLNTLSLCQECFYNMAFRSDVPDEDGDTQKGTSLSTKLHGRDKMSRRQRVKRCARISSIYAMDGKLAYTGDDLRNIALSKLYRRFEMINSVLIVSLKLVRFVFVFLVVSMRILITAICGFIAEQRR